MSNLEKEKGQDLQKRSKRWELLRGLSRLNQKGLLDITGNQVKLVDDDVAKIERVLEDLKKGTLQEKVRKEDFTENTEQ